jgi:hypothetical protein
MFPVPDALAAFYLFCFGVGLVFVFASLFLGLAHDTLNLPGSPGGGDGGGDVGVPDGAPASSGGPDAGTGNMGHKVAAGGHAHHAGHSVSPFNLSTIMAFVTWFGGAGYILRAYAGVQGIASVAAASLVGLLGGAIVFYFLVRVILPGQRILDPADYEVEGTLAKVSVPIRPGGVGEIVYTKGGTRRSEGARSSDGSAIERGTEVVIVKYERGIAYVEAWSSFVAKG